MSTDSSIQVQGSTPCASTRIRFRAFRRTEVEPCLRGFVGWPSQENLHGAIARIGFGAAPVAMPFRGDTQDFWFMDYTRALPAGHNRLSQPDQVIRSLGASEVGRKEPLCHRLGAAMRARRGPLPA